MEIAFKERAKSKKTQQDGRKISEKRIRRKDDHKATHCHLQSYDPGRSARPAARPGGTHTDPATPTDSSGCGHLMLAGSLWPA